MKDKITVLFNSTELPDFDRTKAELFEEYAEEEGWFQGGMGYQGQAFTYELQGNELYFHFLGYETDYGDYMEPSTKMYEVYQLDDTWLVMSDLDFGSYLRGEDISVEELCEALDVDCSPPENTQ